MVQLSRWKQKNSLYMGDVHLDGEQGRARYLEFVRLRMRIPPQPGSKVCTNMYAPRRSQFIPHSMLAAEQRAPCGAR